MKSLLSKVMKNEFLKGGVILTLSSFVVNVFNYFFNFLIGRSLGPSGYGEIATLFSYITLLSIPTVIMSTILIQKIGSADKNKKEYAGLLESFINKKILKLAPFIIIALLISPFLSSITNLSKFTSIFLIPLIVLSLLASIYSSLLNGLKLFFLVSIVTLLSTFLKLLGAILVALQIGGLELVIISLFLSGILSYIGSRWVFHLQLQKTPKTVGKPIEKRLFQVIASPQFIMTTLSITAITALNNIDIIYVKKFFSAEEAGVYSSWSLFAKGIFYLLGPLLSVSYIFFAHNQNSEHRDRSFLLSLSILAALGVVSYFFYSYFASSIINVFFGSKFAEIIPYLGAASIYGSFYAIITFINNFFLSNKSRWALILPLSLPFYVVGLFLVGRELSSLYFLNNLYGSVIVLCYLIAFFLSRK